MYLRFQTHIIGGYMIRFALRDKAVGEEDVFTIDWSAHIADDPLTGVPTAEVLAGTPVIDTLSNNVPNKTSDFWIRGGIKGEVCRALIKVATVGGRALEAEVIFGVR
jgi:hypothetical protein